MINFLKHCFEKKYFKIYRHAKTLFIFDIILLTLATFLLISGLFFYFWQPSISKSIELNFSYSSEKIISGQNIDITINYQNNSKTEMSDAVLAVYLPDGFSLNKEKNIQLSPDNTIELGNILAGGNGKITISGEIIGNILESDKILAILTYKIGKTNKTEQRKELGFINYAGSNIKNELFIQNSVFPDKKIPFTIKLTNISQKNIESLTLKLPYFAKISEKNDFSLLAGQELTLTGLAEIPKTLGVLPFSYSISQKQNDKYFIQNFQESSLEILSPTINLKIIPKTNNLYLEQGEIFPIDIVFENLSGNILQNQQLIIYDQNNILDLPATAAKNNISYNEKGLVINSAGRKIFTDGTNLKSEKFDLDLKLKDNAGFISSNLILIPEFSAELFNSNINFTSTGKELNFKISAGISANISARYYTPEGDQLGRGPLPPQAQQNTKYWIYLNIKNGATKLSDFIFSAKTGPSTLPGEKQSVSYGSPMIFNQDSVVWQKEIVDPFTVFGLYFEVSSTPQKNDIGKELILLQNAKIEATDTATGKKILIDLGPIFNKLTNDDKGNEVDNKVINSDL